MSIWISKKNRSANSHRRLGKRRLRFGRVRDDKRIAFASAVRRPKELTDDTLMGRSMAWQSESDFEQGGIDVSPVLHR